MKPTEITSCFQCGSFTRSITRQNRTPDHFIFDVQQMLREDYPLPPRPRVNPLKSTEHFGLRFLYHEAQWSQNQSYIASQLCRISVETMKCFGLPFGILLPELVHKILRMWKITIFLKRSQSLVSTLWIFGHMTISQESKVRGRVRMVSVGTYAQISCGGCLHTIVSFFFVGANVNSNRELGRASLERMASIFVHPLVRDIRQKTFPSEHLDQLLEIKSWGALVNGKLWSKRLNYTETSALPGHPFAPRKPKTS